MYFPHVGNSNIGLVPGVQGLGLGVVTECFFKSEPCGPYLPASGMLVIGPKSWVSRDCRSSYWIDPDHRIEGPYQGPLVPPRESWGLQGNMQSPTLLP